jgi:hypothetical protein
VLANTNRAQFGLPERGKTRSKAPRGRVCGHDGCVTVLSIYNASADCSVHESRVMKGSRPRA